MFHRLRWWAALLPFVALSIAVVALRQPAVHALTDATDFAARGGLTAYVYTLHYLLAFAIGACQARHRHTLFAAYANLSRRHRLLLGVLAFMLYVYGGAAMSITGLATMMPYDWPLMAAAALLLVIAAAEPAIRRGLECAPLLYLGRVSYSLYLFHPLVLLAMLHLFAGRMPLGWLLLTTFGLCLVVSDLAYRFIERPAIQLSRSAADYIGQIEYLRAGYRL